MKGCHVNFNIIFMPFLSQNVEMWKCFWKMKGGQSCIADIRRIATDMPGERKLNWTCQLLKVSSLEDVLPHVVKSSIKLWVMEFSTIGTDWLRITPMGCEWSHAGWERSGRKIAGVSIKKNVRYKTAISQRGCMGYWKFLRKRMWPRQVTNKNVSIRGLVRIR
jgi:hypothetical protein